MSKLIKQVVRIWRGADDTTAECIEDGSPVDAIEAFNDVRSLSDPAHPISLYLLLDDGARANLPFERGQAYRLPDHSGVLAIFAPGDYTQPDGTDHFPAPNNAAIFNADGSLRCQVHFAGEQERKKDLIIGRFFTRRITHKTFSYDRCGDPIDPPIVQFGILVGTKAHPPEAFYIVNTETGELADGLYYVPF